jgi:hypothetical protein
MVVNVQYVDEYALIDSDRRCFDTEATANKTRKSLSSDPGEYEVHNIVNKELQLSE